MCWVTLERADAQDGGEGGTHVWTGSCPVSVARRRTLPLSSCLARQGHSLGASAPFPVGGGQVKEFWCPGKVPTAQSHALWWVLYLKRLDVQAEPTSLSAPKVPSVSGAQSGCRMGL